MTSNPARAGRVLLLANERPTLAINATGSYLKSSSCHDHGREGSPAGAALELSQSFMRPIC
jgi:hypothetical protein